MNTLGISIGSLLPIGAMLLFMVAFKWSAADAALISLGCAVAVGLLLCGTPVRVLLYAALKGVWSALPILWVIVTALFLYHLIDRVGGFNVIGSFIRGISPNELVQVLAVALGFTGFLQGITGFGVPGAVGAALLVGLGVRPVYAVMMVLTGHAWGNTFGTLGAAFGTLCEVSGIGPQDAAYGELLIFTTLMLWAFNLVAGLAICFFYDGFTGLKKGLPLVLIVSAIQGGGQLLIAPLNADIAAFLPTALALPAIYVAARLFYRTPYRAAESPAMDRTHAQNTTEHTGKATLLQSALPFGCLIAITVAATMVAPVSRWLTAFKLSIRIPALATPLGEIAANPAYGAMAPLALPGTFLLLSALAGYLVYRRRGHLRGGDLGELLKQTAARAARPLRMVVVLFILSRVMSDTGQTGLMAGLAAGLFGSFYPILAPLIGMIGTLITGSNMASNALFGAFQAQMPHAALMAAAQTAGGAIGSMVSPSSLTLAASTAGIPGRESDALRRLLPVAVVIALLFGMGVWVYTVTFTPVMSVVCHA